MIAAMFRDMIKGTLYTGAGYSLKYGRNLKLFPDVKSTTHVMWRLLWGQLCAANRKWHGMRRSWPIWM